MRRAATAFVAAFAVLLLAPPASGQSEEGGAGSSFGEAALGYLKQIWVPRSRYTNSPHVRSAFRSVVAGVRSATVDVRSKGRRVARGGVVGPDGWVLTKASLVRGPVTVRLKDGRELDARLVGVDSATDLGLLKIDAKGLASLDLSEAPRMESRAFVALRTEPSPDEAAAPISEASADEAAPAIDEASSPADEPLAPGDWLATVGVGRDPVAVGVLSVLPRPIEKRSGFLGVGFRRQPAAVERERQAVEVTMVQDDSAAKEVGVRVGDLIAAVDDQPTPDFSSLMAAIGGRNPGDRIRLRVLRGDETVLLEPILRGRNPNPAERRAYYQNSLGSKLSVRRFGFPSAFQHDTVLDTDDVGGPIVDLEGRVVGFNIARAGRTESYALPSSVVRGRLLDLMSGRLAPDADAPTESPATGR